jgi:hypothetical protein
MQCLFHHKGYLGKNVFFIHSAHDDLENLVRARSEQLQRHRREMHSVVHSNSAASLHSRTVEGAAKHL